METETILYIVVGVLAVAVVGLGGFIFYDKRMRAVDDDAAAIADAPPLPPPGSTPSSFLENLRWRRAVKHFSPGEVDLTLIKDAIANAPSSFGIQPYKVLVITDPEVKIHLREACYDQPQVTECHALFVFCTVNDVDARANEMIKMTGAEGVREMVTSFLKGQPDKAAWAGKQAYIALGFALAAAAERRIASCPMEGFNRETLSKMLGLKDVTPVALLAVGQYKEDPDLHPRFRFPDVIA
jgi:nitroreductase